MRPQILGVVLSHEHRQGNLRVNRFGNDSGWTDNLYDLKEIARALDTEPYVYQSVRKHREAILKEGYVIKGDDEERVKYINTRLFEFQVATQQSTNSIIRELVNNLVTYHTAFLVMRRDPRRSSGRKIKMFGEVLNPIAGIFVPNSSTMQTKVDKYGRNYRWRQEVEKEDGTIERREFSKHDVICITVDKKSGFSFGTPYILPVLDDIRALRCLEEIASIVAEQHAFPVYHVKVGTELHPAMQNYDGYDEVAIAKAELENLVFEGNLVTSERYEVNLVNDKGATYDMLPILKYFEDRVMGGLRLSSIDIGRGDSSNKATAASLAKAQQDAAEDYQQVIEDALTSKLLFYLLQEGDYDVTFDSQVHFSFPMIDREEERAHQNHGLQLFLSSAITEEEFRDEYLGKKPLTDREHLHRDMEQKNMLEQARVGAAAKAAASPSSSGTVSNRSRPTNQHGTKATKTKSKANDYTARVDQRYLSLRAELIQAQPDQVKDLMSDFIAEVTELSQDYLDQQIDAGIDRFNGLTLKEVEPGRRAVRRFYSLYVTKSLAKAAIPYGDKIAEQLQVDENGNNNLHYAMGAMEALRKSLRNLTADHWVTAERFGFGYAARKEGYKTFELVSTESDERKEVDLTSNEFRVYFPDGDTDWEMHLPE